ncbi:hypothetical protein G7K_0288-t1 [Saitoella complicata NRRL Y-17804]|uniref:Carnitine O-acetyltransferase, mitochondrial n=2 Tax=Saitoella complicata (strain BCRC 22490 / CBS 7301 / JCM 7358 / NBRC 10748 / NRRL Y-17804) TaxID=698492 RepID=A0A0E9N9F9_SAICN|nr:hypothetical protein G7K_0288-t1 [Saitoella complicata NRRL Y-17804]
MLRSLSTTRHRLPFSQLKLQHMSAPTLVRHNTAAAASAKWAPGIKEDNSKGAMLRFEESLPTLPVPKLAETAAKYLKSLHPILSEEEFKKSEAAIREFVKPGGEGEKLQKRLVQRAQDPTCQNWLAEWWDSGAYMAYRDPVVFFVSYFYAHKDDRLRRDPAKRAAALTTGVLEFKKQVDEKTLEPEYMKGSPIAMSSYKWAFNACRIPAEGEDYSEKYDFKEHKHIVVVRKNKFFKVLHEVDGKQLSAAELEAQFKLIYQMAGTERAPAIGALTSDYRDNWVKSRSALLSASPDNASLIKQIEAASFVVSLDDQTPVTLEEQARQYWHGDGANRWYDKPLHFVVCENGKSGFLGEHSMMDGTPTWRMNDWVCRQIAENKLDYGNPTPRTGLPKPEELKFAINEEVNEKIKSAEATFEKLKSEHDLRVLNYQGYGKNLIKKFKCSPDAFAQMVIQLGYYKMYGVNKPTYESAATRAYKLGRTETIRTVTDDVVAWCRAMEDSNASVERKIELFRKAAATHVRLTVEASAGQGVDRHLYGLKKVLKEGEATPAIFQDPAYSYSSHWFLSTSQLSSEYFTGYGWGEVVSDGYGIAYMVNGDSLNFNIVSKHLQNERMWYHLREAADDLKEMLGVELREGEKARVVKSGEAEVKMKV